MRTRRAWSLTALAACVLGCWPATGAVAATAHHHRHARPLILAQSGVSMRIPAFRLDGRKHEYTITIHPIQITDERSASVGWRLTAVISQFSGVGDSSFRAGAVVRAHCGWTGGTQWATVTSGAALPLGGRPVGLCAAARAHDNRIVSRLFAVSATVTVTIPAYVAAGRYSANMTFTLLARPGI
jgi:hypothetical protein